MKRAQFLEKRRKRINDKPSRSDVTTTSNPAKSSVSKAKPRNANRRKANKLPGVPPRN